MDTVSLQYASLLGATAVLFWIFRKVFISASISGIILLLGGLAFFAAPIWSRPNDSVVERALPVACFVCVLIITQIGVATKKALVPVILLTLILVAAKAAAAWFPKEETSLFAKIIIGSGLSYYILRAIAAVVDASRGTLKNATAPEVCGYLAFAPILSLGPIERATSFINSWRKSVPLSDASRLAFDGICRIGEGLFKTLVMGDVARRFAEPFASGGFAQSDLPSGQLSVAIFSYSLYLYINFSGASDIAIGAARIFGFKITENFDIPYARPNISEFWRAWHISLSTWLRDYLFFPLGKRLPRNAAPIIAPLIVMSLCGAWHGFTLTFVAWGFLHGAGLAIHQLWLRARRGSERIDRLAGNVAWRTLATVVTVFFVTFTWVFFSARSTGDALDHLQRIVIDLAARPDIFAYAALTAAAWSFVPGIRDWLRAKAAQDRITVISQMAAWWRVHIDIVCILVVIARFVLARTQPAGAFVYQNF
ncbi:MAG: MBOAT family O-acyltransferase [Planctomycetota bacterium]